VAIPRPIVIDFETEPIQQRPAYPPKPVGFSIKRPGDRKSTYYAWGHPTENNCTFNEAQQILLDAWEHHDGLLFHNAKFDYDVAMEWMGCAELPWQNIHDTMFLLFLHDPHAPNLQLKPSAERLLGMAPTEQADVEKWVRTNLEKQVREEKKAAGDDSPFQWGAYIGSAPGGLVGKYADGDVIRTEKLFKLLYPLVQQAGMLPAYDRERELMPILLRNEQEGVCVDLPLLKADIKIYEQALATCDAWLRKRLGVPDLNIDSDKDLADKLDELGIVTDWVMTSGGKKGTPQKSVAKKNLTPDMFNDQKVARALGYRNRLSTCLGTFMHTWRGMAEHSGGRVYTNWNQVRQPNARGGKGTSGARTGRLSSNPNFMNLPTTWDDKDDGYAHPVHIRSLPQLPQLRRYFLPDKGCLFGKRDYSQQELRILAHFEDGKLRLAYADDPKLDVHGFVKDEVKNILGVDYERKVIKETNFGRIYGQGIGSLAEKLHITVDEAKRIQEAVNRAIPGLKELDKGIKKGAKEGCPIVTWGGRVYYVEDPKEINKRMVTFEYKLLNYLIQGSAADCTKQAIINYDKMKQHGRFLVTVHDEINISCPKKFIKEEMAILRKAMEMVEFDVAMLSEAEVGPNWGELEKKPTW